MEIGSSRAGWTLPLAAPPATPPATPPPTTRAPMSCPASSVVLIARVLILRALRARLGIGVLVTSAAVPVVLLYLGFAGLP